MLLCLPYYFCIYTAQCFTVFDFYWSWSTRHVVSQKCASNSTLFLHYFFYFSGARCTSFSSYLDYIILNYRKRINNIISSVSDIVHLLKRILTCINIDINKEIRISSKYKNIIKHLRKFLERFNNCSENFFK